MGSVFCKLQPFKASNEGQWGQKLKFSDVETCTYFFVFLRQCYGDLCLGCNPRALKKKINFFI